MNKNDFILILEATLLSFEGITQNQLILNGMTNFQANAGIKLCEYLQSIKVPNTQLNQIGGLKNE